MGEEWQMPRRGEACEICRRAFAPGATVQAYLFESPEGYARRDYCAACEPPDAALATAAWRTRRPEPAAKKAAAFDREAIYKLFETLDGAEAPQQRRLRFVLALLLWRKKVLKFEHSDVAMGVETWHYTTPRSGTAHAVARPELDEAQLEQLGTQLEDLLAGQVGDFNCLVPETDGGTDEAT